MLRAPLVVTPLILEEHRSTVRRRHAWPATRGKSPEGLSVNHFAAQNEFRRRLAWFLPDAAESFRIASGLPPMPDSPEAQCETNRAPAVAGQPTHTLRQAPSNNSRSVDQSSQPGADR